jgi:arabinan endo-1,5-alpha-L-arabinosidase
MSSPLTYQNPVWPGYFADPFVLKTQRGYFAYGTGPTGPAGRLFPILYSTDLIHWEPRGGALEPLRDPPAITYWAPEVAMKDGRYYLFYSASTSHSDADHRLRVATADQPEGPFQDSGRILIPKIGFTIDGDPFRDPKSGEWFIFFATDYETDAPFGTGLAVARLSQDLMEIMGEPTPVARASAPWQVYEKNRDYKGKVWPAWNCVEGPSVVYHEGKYYCFYSAGAWYGDHYGVGFAVADHPLGPWRDEYAAQGPNVLKGIPGKVIGPGHNSVVLGPDGSTLFMIYHAWDAEKTARRMCIDPIHWTADGPKVDGPSTERRPLLV